MGFYAVDMFCDKCFLHDTFWNGGNSWGIDYCPNCGNQSTILWENMSSEQKKIASKLFEEWWQKERIKKEN